MRGLRERHKREARIFAIICAMTIEEQVEIAAKALADSKGVDVKTYDVRGKSSLTDFFIVATGSAAPHLKALVAAVEAALKDAGANAYRTSGEPDSGWIVVDFIDFVVHVFSPEARAYYALERLWTA